MAEDIKDNNSSPEPKSKTYEGNCHCGKVKFSFHIAPPIEEQPVTNCNCSICGRNGYLFVYPEKKNVTFHSGEDSLTKYTFETSQRIQHFFCPVCGTSLFAQSMDPSFAYENLAVNVRTLKGIDLDSLECKKFDGRALGLPYPHGF